MYEEVFSPLSICVALTPSVLRLFPSITMYLSFVVSSPFSQAPLVYEPRKNSSEVRRSSTPSQYGNCPSVLRVLGRLVIPAPKVTKRLKFHDRLPAPTTCAGSPCDVFADQTYR